MTWKSSGLKVRVDPDFFYLLEALRVEGYWSTKYREAAIDNKNIPLLKNIQRILNKNKINYTKRFIIKIRLPNKRIKKKDIKIFFKNMEIGSHIEKSPFDKKKKIVFQLPYRKKQNVLLKFKNQKIPITITEGRETLEINCKFESFGYLEVRFHNAEFIRVIEELSNGRGSLNIRVNSFLTKFPPQYIMAAFSAVIDCEGTIDFYRHFRKIRIRMFNQNYLKDWQNILANLGIISRCNLEEGLAIEGFEDFNKLKNLGLKLCHSKKKLKFYKILNSYKRKQVSRNRALDFYLNELKKIGKPLSANEFAKLTGKSKRVINHHLLRLQKKGLLKIDKAKVTWLYSVN